MRIPDGIEPVSAYRAWRVVSPGLLASILDHEFLWPTGEAVRATTALCRSEFGDFHPGSEEPPADDCVCGLYGLDRLEDVVAQVGMGDPRGEGDGFVVGRAEFWGKVVLAEDGLRAEYARPVEVFPFWPEIDHERLGLRVGPPLLDFFAGAGEVVFLGGPLCGMCVSHQTADRLSAAWDGELRDEAVDFAGEAVRGLFRWFDANFSLYYRVGDRAFLPDYEKREPQPRDTLILEGRDFVDLLEEVAGRLAPAEA